MEPGEIDGINLQAQATTDSDGSFRFGKVPAGPLVICRYFNFNRDGLGQIGMSHHKSITVQPGTISEVTLGGNGQMLVGQLRLSEVIRNHEWRDDLQSLTRDGPRPPQFPGNLGSPDSPAWREFNRQLTRFTALERKYYLDIQPDGKFRIEDVEPGQYTLNLEISKPATGNFAERLRRKRLGKKSIPVSVPADGIQPIDLGVITISVEPAGN